MAKKVTKKKAAGKKKTAKKKTAKKKTAKQAAGGTAPNLKPPKSVRDQFARGLELKDDYGGKGLVANTVTWARKIVAGKPLDPGKARKMHAYFKRHAVDRKPGWSKPPTPGYVAWLLWGGDPGRTWIERVVAKLDA